PGVVNRSEGEAKAVIEEAKLQFQIGGKEYSEQIEKGMVLTQEPLPGRAIALGSMVEVVICGGIQEEQLVVGEIPDLYLETAEAADQKLQAAGDIIITREFMYNRQYKPGLVISQKEIPRSDGMREIKLTISIGSDEISEGKVIHGVPYAEVEMNENLPYVNYIAPFKDEESMWVQFEYQQGNDDWKAIDTFSGRAGFQSYSQIPVNMPQELIKEDILICLARNQSLRSGEPIKLRMNVLPYNYHEDVYTELSHSVIIHNDVRAHPPIEISSVEEMDWNEVDEQAYNKNYGDDGTDVHAYLVRGNFKKAEAYYVYEGEARRGKNRVVHCTEDGELLLLTEDAFDGSSVLARFISLYGTARREDGTYEMTVGGITTVDGQSMVLKGELSGDIRGMAVFDGISVLAEAAGPYRYRLPYLFSNVYDENVKRGCIVDYYLEGDSHTGEVYTLNIIISNGRKEEATDEMVVPIQWIPNYWEEDAKYALLHFLTLPTNVETIHWGDTVISVSGDDGKTWYNDIGQGNGPHMQTSVLRSNGSPDDYTGADGIAYMDFLPKYIPELQKQSETNSLLMKLTPTKVQSTEAAGESAILAIPLISDMP
ncbi:PASTA domain-containing protein, partial [Christensenellaceae bacterium OttesenSCG-928-M15]|nr:PASTA domain-containing protein [Christensenellaceae bacterium OttesenSCG-928-M15]